MIARKILIAIAQKVPAEMAKLWASPDFFLIATLAVVAVSGAIVCVQGELSLRRPRDITRVALISPHTKMFVGGAVCIVSFIVAGLMTLKVMG